MTAALVRDKAAIVPAPHASSRPGFVPGVTTVILTFDEEIHIARAIACVQAFSREVLVVDSFSRDRTVEIARAMGARVVQNAWSTTRASSVSRWRNAASKASGCCASMPTSGSATISPLPCAKPCRDCRAM
jgi:hypothetical protein